MDDDQQFCLRWNNHQSTLVAVFDTLLENGTLVDCTLAAEGKFLNAHKVVLSACSPYFEALLSKHFDKHPILILKDVKFQELKAMMDYMYRGEVNISQDQLGALLKAAESLQIKGLSDNRKGETERKPTPAPPPPKSPQPTTSLPKVQGLTIEQRPRDDSREGSMSPGPRKKKRMRRKSEELDNHDASNSSESHSLPAQNIPTLPAVSKINADVPEQIETKSEILTRHKQTDEMPQVPIIKEKIETHTELMLEPKAEYVDDMNEDSIEDLTLDDDDLSNMEQMDEQAGPSHGNAGEGSSQGFGGWHMGNQSQDEVFLAAQEAVGAHRDSQGKNLMLRNPFLNEDKCTQTTFSKKQKQKSKEKGKAVIQVLPNGKIQKTFQCINDNCAQFVKKNRKYCITCLNKFQAILAEETKDDVEMAKKDQKVDGVNKNEDNTKTFKKSQEVDAVNKNKENTKTFKKAQEVDGVNKKNENTKELDGVNTKTSELVKKSSNLQVDDFKTKSDTEDRSITAKLVKKADGEQTKIKKQQTTIQARKCSYCKCVGHSIQACQKRKQNKPNKYSYGHQCDPCQLFKELKKPACLSCQNRYALKFKKFYNYGDDCEECVPLKQRGHKACSSCQKRPIGNVFNYGRNCEVCNLLKDQNLPACSSCSKTETNKKPSKRTTRSRSVCVDTFRKFASTDCFEGSETESSKMSEAGNSKMSEARTSTVTQAGSSKMSEARTSTVTQAGNYKLSEAGSSRLSEAESSRLSETGKFKEAATQYSKGVRSELITNSIEQNRSVIDSEIEKNVTKPVITNGKGSCADIFTNTMQIVDSDEDNDMDFNEDDDDVFDEYVSLKDLLNE